MDASEIVWNRAALEGGGPNPLEGDRALAALLLAHGLVMNGGVLHAAETLGAESVRAACDGYRHFGFDSVPVVFERAEALVASGDDDQLESGETELNTEYYAAIPDDNAIVTTFRQHLDDHPEQFRAAHPR